MQTRYSLVPSALVLAVAFSSSAFAQAKPKPQKIGGKIEWVYDYGEGKRLSGSTGRPMFVVFRCER